MNLNRRAFFVILMAVVCIGQPAFAQQTTPANADQVFVPLPDDIDCILGNATTTATAVNDPMKGLVLVHTVDVVETVTCHITGNSPTQAKEISLASSKVSIDWMLRTKDFGDFKLSVRVGTSNGATYFKNIDIAIRRDKLQSFRDFLQQ
jgi:hypothetical protein